MTCYTANAFIVHRDPKRHVHMDWAHIEFIYSYIKTMWWELTQHMMSIKLTNVFSDKRRNKNPVHLTSVLIILSVYGRWSSSTTQSAKKAGESPRAYFFYLFCISGSLLTWGESFPFYFGFYGKVLNCLLSAVRNDLSSAPPPLAW